MTPSDWAAWYAAVVSTVVAFAGYISHRRKNAAVLHIVADYHPRAWAGEAGQDLRVVIRNTGGMPTTVTHVAPVQTAWRCPAWMMQWTLGRKLARVKVAGGNQVQTSKFQLQANGAEWRMVFASWPDDIEALRTGRYWAIVAHSAAMGEPVVLPIRHGLV